MHLSENMPRLLVRVPLAQGEGHHEHLLRLAHVNGLPEASWLVLAGTRSVELRLCPECLREFGQWSECWRKAEFPVCRAHGCWLVDRCADCGSKFLWPRLGFCRCQCGADLMSVQTQRPGLSVQSELASNHQSPIEVLLWLGAWSIYGPKGKPLKKASCLALDTRKDLLTRGVDMVSNWPHAFLDALALHRMPSPVGQLQSLSEAWPGLPVQIRRLDNETWRQKIWDSINVFVGQTLTSESPIVGRNPSLRLRPPTQKDVANRLRIGVSRLAGISTSQVSGVPFKESKAGRRRIAISHRSEQLLIEQISAIVTVRECAQLLGCSRKRVSAFIASGTLVSNSNRISRKAALQLRDSILTVADSTTDNSKALSLADCFQYRVPLRSADAFINALIQRGIRCSLRPGALNWNGVQVHVTDLESWLKEDQSGTDSLLSVQESAAVLRIKEQVVYGLVKRGLIASINVPGTGMRIQRQALIDFEERYVALSEWVGSPRALGNKAYEWARGQGLDLVTGPRLDGGRQYFVRRNYGA